MVNLRKPVFKSPIQKSSISFSSRASESRELGDFLKQAFLQDDDSKHDVSFKHWLGRATKGREKGCVVGDAFNVESFHKYLSACMDQGSIPANFSASYEVYNGCPDCKDCFVSLYTTSRTPNLATGNVTASQTEFLRAKYSCKS